MKNFRAETFVVQDLWPLRQINATQNKAFPGDPVRIGLNDEKLNLRRRKFGMELTNQTIMKIKRS